MTGRITAIFCIMITLAMTLIGVNRASGMGRSVQEAQVEGGAGIGGLAQIRMATPTPQSMDTDEQESPIPSEVGKDVGLVLGSAVLVLIVVAGLFIGYYSGRKHAPKRGSRD